MRFASIVVSLAVVAGCASSGTAQNAEPPSGASAMPTLNPGRAFAQTIRRDVVAHKTGARVELSSSDAQRAVRTFTAAANLLPNIPYSVDCPAALNLAGARRGTCIVHVAGKRVPYDLWIDDDAGQMRMGGHGYAVETSRIRNAIARSIALRLPRTDVSPYDVNCGDATVTIIQQGSALRCAFTADGMIFLFSARFVGISTRLQVDMLSHR